MKQMLCALSLLAMLLVAPARAEDQQDKIHPLFGDIESLFKQQHCLSALSRTQGRLPDLGDLRWDILHAELHFNPDFDAELLDGEVIFDCRSTSNNVGELLVDLRDNMNVLTVELNGAPAGYLQGGDRITVNVVPPLMADDLFTLRIVYSGSPQSSGFGSFAWDSHVGVPLVWTLSEPTGAHDWWPCKDVPDDKFTADVYYRVRSDFKAPGPGLLQSITDMGDGTSIWHWHESYPINSYLIALTSTNYELQTDWYTDSDGVTFPIQNYVFGEDYDASVEDLSVTPAAMALLDSVFGPYPFRNEKYGHMVFKWGGAMEHQTCTSFGSWLLAGDHRYDRIVVHELAHQWFGDAVTLRDWENVWLNEGFASYGEALWFEHIGGQDGLTDWMTETTADGFFDGPVYNNPNLFGSTVYRKGAWVLHMLRYLLGDQRFFGALRYYYEQHEYGNAHTEDLITDLEDYSGEDLDQFFDQWVYGSYRPVYEWGWQKEGGPGSWLLKLQVRQVQDNAGLFIMPLPFRVVTAMGTEDLRVQNDHWLQNYSILMGDQEPLGVEFDPENWVLENSGEVPFDPTGVDESPAWSTALSGNWPNPFNPRTRIEFSLAEPSRVRLDVFDSAGRHVRSLLAGKRDAGPLSAVWDGLDDAGRAVPSGVYLARLATADRVFSHRMTLLK